MPDEFISLEEIEKIPAERCPMICLANGFTSVFGLMISLRLKEFWTHAMWLMTPEILASQWFWFTRFRIGVFNKHSLKLWWNPRWTPEQRAILKSEINRRLAMPKWKTRYDLLAVVGEALGLSWLQNKRVDFCSEAVCNILAGVEPAIREWELFDKSPRPEELNAWLKAQRNEDETPRYEVYARVMPG